MRFLIANTRLGAGPGPVLVDPDAGAEIVAVDWKPVLAVAEEHARAAQVQDRYRTLAGDAFKVNLIPYNPTGAFTGSSAKGIAAFKGVLDRAGVPATVRLTRGRDIEAACGQLAASRISTNA